MFLMLQCSSCPFLSARAETSTILVRLPRSSPRLRRISLTANILTHTDVSVRPVETLTVYKLVGILAPEAPDGTKWYVSSLLLSIAQSSRNLQGAQPAGMSSKQATSCIVQVTHIFPSPLLSRLLGLSSSTNRTTKRTVGQVINYALLYSLRECCLLFAFPSIGPVFDRHCVQIHWARLQKSNN